MGNTLLGVIKVGSVAPAYAPAAVFLVVRLVVVCRTAVWPVVMSSAAIDLRSTTYMVPIGPLACWLIPILLIYRAVSMKS